MKIHRRYDKRRLVHAGGHCQCGKIPYGTQEKAELAARRSGNPTLVAYWSVACGRWHIGHIFGTKNR